VVSGSRIPLKSTARGRQNKQNCLRHVPLTSVKKILKYLLGKYQHYVVSTESKILNLVLHKLKERCIYNM
jgi:hypothetical protein